MHDRYIPSPDRSSRHSITIDAAPEKIWPIVRELDVSDSFVIGVLFRLRGLGGVRSLASVERIGFQVLTEVPGQFLGIGLIGRPWQPGGGIVVLDDPDGWREFNEPGYAKVSWTFALTPQSTGQTVVTTETRVACTDAAARKRFARYWRVVGPFSGLVRREMLRGIRRKAKRT